MTNGEKSHQKVADNSEIKILTVVGARPNFMKVVPMVAAINDARPLIVNVEADLRSFDRAMPEEVNRVLADHVSDLLFVTEESGLRNLAKEGIPAEKFHFVGNTMIDSLLAFQGKSRSI